MNYWRGLGILREFTTGCGTKIRKKILIGLINRMCLLRELLVGCCRVIDVPLDVFEVLFCFCGVDVVDGAFVTWLTVLHQAAKDADIDVTVFCGEVMDGPPVHIVDFPAVSA